MFLRKSLPGVLGILLLFAAVAFGQEQQPQTPTGTPEGALRQRERQERKERHRERMRRHERGEFGWHGHGGGRFMQELNLSDAQREQRRAIIQRRLEATKGQREELFRLREKRIMGTFTEEDATRAQALRQEIRSSMEGVQTEMESILTPEQRTKLEDLKKQRKEKMEQRLKERQERRRERQQRLETQL